MRVSWIYYSLIVILSVENIKSKFYGISGGGFIPKSNICKYIFENIYILQLVLFA